LGGTVSLFIKAFVSWIIITMTIDMVTYSRNDTDSVPDMLTMEALEKKVTLEDMSMEFYFLVKSKNGEVRPINTLDKYISVQSGQYDSVPGTTVYNNLIDCMEGDEDFASGEENYNPVWYNYLKDNRASCFDPQIDYSF
jgi:hypothetical protein